MTSHARHRRFLAALLLLPMLAATQAHADTASGDHHEDSGDHHDSGGEHHDSGGDGHNDDGTSQQSSSSTPTSGTSSQGGSGSSIFDTGQHRRFGDFVASPTLDPQQTKAAIAGGQAASMPLLLAYLNQNYPGQVLDVKLHSASDGYVYEVRYLSNAIFLRTLFLDAMTLKAK